MKRLHLALSMLLLSTASVFAQEAEVRPATFGFGLYVNDFTTVRNIRNSSIETVINNKQYSRLRDFSPGIGVSYAKGLKPRVDFAAMLGFASGNVVLRNKPDQEQATTVISADASVQFKMFPESFAVIPYVSAGVGATIAKGYYGAILPVGVGFRVRITDEVAFGVQSQYRIAVTETAGYHLMHGISILGRL